MHDTLRILALAALVALPIHAPVRAQCLDWKPGFGRQGAFSVSSAINFDDGSGPSLYIGGNFLTIDDLAAKNVAEWDGVQWSAMGGGISGGVAAFAVFNDGTGAKLYAAGSFPTAGGVAASNIARWDGSTWSPLSSGTNGPIYTLDVFNDGTGPALYAGGQFTTAGGVSANRVAKWNGSAWSPLGTGISGGASPYVFTLTVFDDGGGLGLYAGGNFTTAGGVAASRIARWRGGSWSPLAGGLDDTVFATRVFDDGGGRDLYVGGNFLNAGGSAASQIARWDGTSWSSVGGGIDNADPENTWVGAFNVYDDGSGPALYAGGGFFSVGGVLARSIARWNGSSWSPLGAGIDGSVSDIVPFNAGTPELVVVGGMNSAGGVSTAGLASWKASAWTRVGAGGYHALDGMVNALATFDDGTGLGLYAGGTFRRADGVFVGSIARWDGSSWSPLNSGLRCCFPSYFGANVLALTTFDDGTGEALYVTGRFEDAYNVPVNLNNIGRWDGTSWSPLGTGIRGFSSVDGGRAMVAFDDGSGPALYVGGIFDEAGGVVMENIGKWDGSSWSALGAGLDSEVDCLAVFDDGGGPKLYAGGAFLNSGGTPVSKIARWDGSTWSPVGAGFNGQIFSLAAYDDGNGSRLYASGNFTNSGGAPINHVAKWNGASWSTLGGFVGRADALTVFDDGSGPALYAGGPLTSAGGVPVNGIAKWDGSHWSALGSGTNETVHALAAFDDGSGPALFAGGEFTIAGATASYYIGAWRGCGGPGTMFCAGDGTFSACPCANTGLPGHGCENSASTGGALLYSSGTTNPDTVVLHASGERSDALTIFLQGNANLTPGVVYGDGIRCAGGGLKRLYTKTASGGAISAPSPGDLSIQARSAALGDTIAPGGRRYYQTYYRDGNPAFCSPPAGSTFNSSNGVKINW